MSTLLALFIALLFTLPLSWIRALAIMKLAEWFIVPLAPGLMLPSTGFVMGLLVLVGLVLHHQSPKSDDEEPWSPLVRGILESLAESGIAVAVGALIRGVFL
jgi:hypothetical protein